jgi:hypothetical protein
MKKSTSQSGATLVVALIFLVLMSLFAISAFNSSSSNLRIMGNTQARQESLAAAQMAIESTISSTNFFQNPTGVASVLVDVDGNSVTDYTAKLFPAPTCYRAKPILAGDLPAAPKDPAVSDPYSPCRPSQRLGGTYIDRDTPLTGADPESCANSEWNIRAEVTDTKSNTYVAANQGVGVIVFGNEVSSNCK